MDYTRIHGKRRAALLFLLFTCLFLYFCARELSPPAPFSTGTPIPLGPYRVTVTRSTENAYGAGSGNMYVDVEFHLSGTGPIAERDFTEFLISFRLMDMDGKKYRSLDTHPLDMLTYEATQEAGKPTGFGHDWTARFMAPQDSHGFSVLIPNPDPFPVEGQPDIAQVRV